VASRLSKVSGQTDSEMSRFKIIRGRLSLRWRNIVLRFVHLRCLIRARFGRKPAVHVIGDSHTGIFRRKKPFIVHWLGPATAYSLKSPRSTTMSYRKLKRILNNLIAEGDKVLLLFGEVDCRIHLYNQYVLSGGTKTLEEVVDDTVNRYGEVLGEIDKMGIDFHVGCVTPGGTEPNVFGVPNYPPPEMRPVINRVFNERLSEYCRVHGYSFIDVFSVVVDEEGFIKTEYRSQDGTHLNARGVSLFQERLGL
jgi:lysophospholipase L1-like esterase